LLRERDSVIKQLVFIHAFAPGSKKRGIKDIIDGLNSAGEK
jgi:hypothetical protein